MNRKTFAIRQFVAAGLALLAILGVLGLLHCGGALPPAEEMDDLNLKLAQCRAEGRDAKDAGNVNAFMKYEDCKRRLGVQK